MEWPLGCPHIRGRQSGERLVEAPDMIIDADGLTDGVTFALRGHLAPWKDLDIIRLSDVLKHMPLMGKRELGTEFDSYRAYAKTQGRQGFSQRIYASPVSHEENFNCSCVYCKYVCEETMEHMLGRNESGYEIYQYILDKVSERVLIIVSGVVKLVFQQEANAINLNSEIAYGFNTVLPILVVTDFEAMFKAFYNEMGIELAYEVVDKLALLIQYSTSYENCYYFVTFWIEIVNEVCTLSIEMSEDYLGAFDWKLRRYNCDFTTFLVYFLAHFIHSSIEFQAALSSCFRIVQRHRRSRGTPTNEYSTKWIKEKFNIIKDCLESVEQRWSKKVLPFDFIDLETPMWNLFKVVQVQNPFLLPVRNSWEAYQVQLGRESGKSVFRKLDNETWDLYANELPEVEMRMTCHKLPNLSVEIHVHKAPESLPMPELVAAVRRSDITYLRENGFAPTVTALGPERAKNCQLATRKKLKLDTLQGFEGIDADTKEFILSARESTRKIVTGKSQQLQPPLCPIQKFCQVRRRRKSYPRLVVSKLIHKYCRRFLRYREIRFQRYSYAFGGLVSKPRRPTPEDRIKEAQDYNIVSDALSIAVMKASQMFNLSGKEGGQRYLVGVRLSRKEEDETKPGLIEQLNHHQSQRQFRRQYLETKMVRIMTVLYDCMYAINLISLEDCQKSTIGFEKEYAACKLHRLKKGLDQKEIHKPIGVERPNVVTANLSDTDKNKLIPKMTVKKPEECVDDHQRRTSGEFEIRQMKKKLSEIRGDKVESDESLDSDEELCQVHLMQKKNALDTLEIRVQKDGSVVGYATNGDISSSCNMLSNPQAGRSVKSVPPEEIFGPAAGCKRPTRPGLPVNSGYAKTRQHLREKLKREKTQNESITTGQTQDPANDSNQPEQSIDNSHIVKQKKIPAEVVTTNTVPLPTEDVDELVSMIEGTHISRTEKGTTESSDPKKLAKKARQREKKRLEEESLRKAEEERLRQEEEERVRTEQAEREEELRKKREKKKKRKKGKKAAASGETEFEQVEESKELSSDLLANVGSVVTSVGLSSVLGHSKVEGEPSKSSEMVTIRRHPTAPDTTVTISVKSDTGDEDLLYTLVNGQVYVESKSDKPNGSLAISNAAKPSTSTSSPCVHTSELATSKGKSKNKEKKNGMSESFPIVSGVSSGKGSGTVILEDNVRNYEGHWFAGAEFTIPNSANPGFSSYLPPFVQNVSPIVTGSTSLSQNMTNGPGKSFSFFTNLEGDEIDLSKLKLPPGITITKVTQSVSESSEDGALIPPRGAGLYNIESNMIVMNPDYEEGDEEYNSDDIYLNHTKPGTFETVLSNKEKRKRSKANKCDEVEGNGSNERSSSRGNTPGANGNLSQGKGGKRGSDAGLKNAGNISKGDRKASSRPGSAGKNGPNVKSETYKGIEPNRKSRKLQSHKTGSDVSGSKVAPRLIKSQKESSSTNSCHLVTAGKTYLKPQSPSTSGTWHSESVPRPLPISCHYGIKMADVVTGAHIKLRNPEGVSSGFPTNSPTAMSVIGEPTATGGNDKVRNVFIPNQKQNSSQYTPVGDLRIEVHPESVSSKLSSDEQRSKEETVYSLWNSTPQQEKDNLSGARPGGQSAYELYDPQECFNEFKNLEDMVDETRKKYLGSMFCENSPSVKMDKISPPLPPIQRPSPSYSASPPVQPPHRRESPLPFQFGTSNHNRLGFQFGSPCHRSSPSFGNFQPQPSPLTRDYQHSTSSLFGLKEQKKRFDDVKEAKSSLGFGKMDSSLSVSFDSLSDRTSLLTFRDLQESSVEFPNLLVSRDLLKCSNEKMHDPFGKFYEQGTPQIVREGKERTNSVYGSQKESNFSFGRKKEPSGSVGLGTQQSVPFGSHHQFEPIPLQHLYTNGQKQKEQNLLEYSHNTTLSAHTFTTRQQQEPATSHDFGCFHRQKGLKTVPFEHQQNVPTSVHSFHCQSATIHGFGDYEHQNSMMPQGFNSQYQYRDRNTSESFCGYDIEPSAFHGPQEYEESVYEEVPIGYEQEEITVYGGEENAHLTTEYASFGPPFRGEGHGCNKGIGMSPSPYAEYFPTVSGPTHEVQSFHNAVTGQLRGKNYETGPLYGFTDSHLGTLPLAGMTPYYLGPVPYPHATQSVPPPPSPAPNQTPSTNQTPSPHPSGSQSQYTLF